MKKITYILLTVLITLSISSIVLATNSQEPPKVINIESNNYIVSKQNKLVSRILPKTTIETVKKSFSVNSNQVHIFDKTGKSEVKQGYIGTGMQIKFDNHDVTYIASVIGDINGDGEITQYEVSKAIKHVIGLEKHQLSGVNAVSIDVSGDGVITQKDVSILIKYVVYGKLDIGEVKRPTSPVISFVSGEEGEDNWYTSDVVLRVNKPENSPIPIEKMTCIITGTVEKEETEIKDGQNITIELEGTYEIKCYSVAQNGVKSLAATKTVKIDKTAPISANLLGTMKDENGAQYSFGTTSNQNVYLRAIGGEDVISKIKETTIEATGATKLPKGTKLPVLIENDGTTEIILTTKNGAGFTTTKNYTVIIDKVIKEAGTVITKLNSQDGDIYEENTWTNQNVYVEVQKGGENITTTYKVEGANEVYETSEPTILTEEGISTITIINKDEVGNMSKRTMIVKIDKKAPTKPILEVTGNKIISDGQWYTSDVQVKMSAEKQGNNAKVTHIEYVSKETKYDVTKTGTVINKESLTIVEEGIYELTAYAVDEAGNKSEGTTVTIKLDTTDPIAGTMSLYTNDENGEIYVNNAWTNQSIYAELVNGSDELSGHANTTYKVEGEAVVEESKEPITLTKQGIYTVTVTTTDVSGRASQRVYTIRIDKEKPDAPTLEVISGTKADPRIEWYNSYTTYEATGDDTIEESRIEDHGKIQVVSEGVYNITAYNYDVAGNKSEGTTVTVKIDKTAPQNIQITASEIKGKEFKLQVSAEETASGVALYQIYIDGTLYKEIQKNETQIECNVENQLSGEHTVMVKVKDIAGNENQAEIQVNMGRLEIDDIDHIEFVVGSFTQTKDENVVNSGADFVISDTSVSDATKYIQVGSSENGVVGEISGTIRVVRKDGSIVDKFEYYPENLIFELAQYSDGSGSIWEHEANINLANTTLSNEDIEEGTNNNARFNINDKQNTDNIFKVTDKKTMGTKTYTRLIIRQITLNEQKVPFKILSNVV